MRSKKRSRTQQFAPESVKRRRLSVEVDHDDEHDEEPDDEDEIRDFRRVQIVHENRQQETRPTHLFTQNDVSGQSTSHSHEHANDDDGQETLDVADGASQNSGTPTISIDTSLWMRSDISASVNLDGDPPSDFPRPKLDRTMHDILSDELYNPDFMTDASMSSKANRASTTTPRNGLFAQRLQAAKHHHSISRSNPSLPPPFRSTSPLAPAHNTPYTQTSNMGFSAADLMLDNLQSMADTSGNLDFDYATFDFDFAPSGP